MLPLDDRANGPPQYKVLKLASAGL